MTMQSAQIRRAACGALSSLILAFPSSAGPATQDEVIHFSATQLRADVAKTVDGLATATLPTGPAALVIMARREHSGEVEVHAKLNDVFVVHSGRAAILVGGQVHGNRET